jgi:2'-5' RNA ligase
MSYDSPERGCDVPPEERLNIYALVIYIPDPLGYFLDNLRRELVPAYNPHAHVSVLPPRSLSVDWTDADRQARALTENGSAFEVTLSSVEIFPATNVIYIEVDKGATELRGLHRAMNSSALAFDEPFAYHPHITLAQEVPLEQVSEVHELAVRRWREFRGSRSFRAERAVFVQNTLRGCWIDLAAYSFGGVATLNSANVKS